MSEKRRNRRIKNRNINQSEKSTISKRSKIIWIGIIVISVLLFSSLLSLQFLEHFIIVD
ncbi:hypothetical protein LX77_02045 [Gelidibacter algens]|uniref:Uncharacterized protein n=1 Tax=Gelidibacter algens TaxID=49280 RepID=A0A327S6C3_9FLAO|nr:hypothetical protein LX77_02045 [Gelidibacter algens]